MAKAIFTEEDDELLSELGVEVELKQTGLRTPREERIIAGFEDIERFYEKHNRLPQHGEDRDIFERLYAVRLDKMRGSEECLLLLTDIDKYGLFKNTQNVNAVLVDTLDDDELLAALGIDEPDENDITHLTHVKTRAEIRAAEDIAKRTPCLDFDKYKPLFIKVQDELYTGIRKSREFKENAQIKLGEYFILGGQKAFVAEIGEEIKAPNGDWDARLRLIYDNGTESNLLRRSLQRALYKDDAGRRITEPSAGPLFADTVDDDDIESGTIYVLRSLSDYPQIKANRHVIHKIGVTSNDMQKRIANAKLDPTFLMAEVEVVATYELSNINRVKLERLIHKFFEPAKLNIEITDRFGTPIVPREWFLVPLFVIDEAILKIKDGSIVDYHYDAKMQGIINFRKDK